MELILNGINADTGGYFTEGVTTRLIAKVARGLKLDADDLRDVRLRRSFEAIQKYHMRVGEGIDANDLAQAGWGVLFPASLRQEMLDSLLGALHPLLELRKGQAKTLYRELHGENGYLPGETKNEFLKRFGRGPGPVNPQKFPYYVLIVGDPEDIPFTFQYQLDVAHAVGRIWFERLEDYHQYALSVARSETAGCPRGKKAAFWGTAFSEDQATIISANHLIHPLAESTRSENARWEVEAVAPVSATKSNLTAYLGGEKTPALFFAASHGTAFKNGDPRQIPHQGALICQDWPGPIEEKPVTERDYFSAGDVSASADVSGMIAFIFACFGAGTPMMNNFYRLAFGGQGQIAPHDFLARLPLRLLSHPNGGALAVFAHVDLVWTNSILWDNTVHDVEPFENMIRALLSGKTAGYAAEYMNSRYAEISENLNMEIERVELEEASEIRLAGMWTASTDARNYILVGDPAVRLRFVEP